MASEDGAASAGQLAQGIENYLADHPAAALLEDGRVVFDMRTARYAVSESHGRCLLQLWSDERNLVRTVVEVLERAQCLRLMTRRKRSNLSPPATVARPRPAMPAAATTSDCWSEC